MEHYDYNSMLVERNHRYTISDRVRNIIKNGLHGTATLRDVMLQRNAIAFKTTPLIRSANGPGFRDELQPDSQITSFLGLRGARLQVFGPECHIRLIFSPK
jgi:hypothetical protein